jgi:hypothetical protein
MPSRKKKEYVKKDDSLFGLLVSYKANNTYVNVISDEESQTVAVVISKSPVNWSRIDDTEYGTYRPMRRLDLGVERLFVKYLHPEQIIKILGPAIGIALPVNRIEIDDRLGDRGYYVIKTGSRYLVRVISGVKKIINLTPQKKYEILEKCIAEEQED